jgi:hypothetical protein
MMGRYSNGLRLVLDLFFSSMGVSGWLFAEAKSFEFVVDEGVSILRIFERSRGIFRIGPCG